jgi:hypothetical protein
VFVSGVAGCPSTLQSVLLELVVLCCLSVWMASALKTVGV